MRNAGLLAALLWATAALANDSAAVTGAGGLVLVRNGDVDMVSEDLFVSAERVRVRYVFRNRTTRPVRLNVAFPLPDFDLSDFGEGDRGHLSGFSTRVDGRPVRMQVERRAFARGVEHSALLRRLGIPFAGGVNGYDPGPISAALNRLPPAEQRRLEQLGLVEGFNDGGTRRYDARWLVKETWHWEQVFPAGRDLVVEHSYAPGTGGTVSTAFGNPQIRGEDHMREGIRRYCADAEFLAAAERMVRRPGVVNVSEQWIRYILTTGGNWRSPIADFRLVVDKGRPQNLVSFCGEGVRRISPTQFEMRRRNWRPDRDLDILILVPAGEGD
ncbi:MAG TPA: DUF4424 domain-containing protein [Allosphingosinicella sp.]|nr:DUF4424 domain-containing protein [Allosphingosinicella sp.]